MPKSFLANITITSLSISFVLQRLKYLTNIWEATFITKYFFKILVEILYITS